MSNTDDQSTAPADNTIQPAQVSLNVGPTSLNQSNTTRKNAWQEHRFTLFGIGLGLVLLIAVIFVLPNKISVDVDPTDDELANEDVTPITKGPTESPWQEQQFGKERRQTQEILAKLLDKQKQLEEIQVWMWAEAEYTEAKMFAEQADIDYRQQEFLNAQQGYDKTLAQFNVLLARSKSLYTESLAQGEQAILDGDDTLAKQHFELAAIIEPLEEAPKKGLQRTGVLASVIQKVMTGKQLQRQNQLEEAKQRYLDALSLDEESVLAKQHITEVDIAIRERDFGQQMSLGYAAINAQQFDKAVASFDRAATIKPNAEDAKAALLQAKNERALANIQASIQTAEKHEAKEQWQDALDNFNQALALDNNLVTARVGAIRTKARAEVDKKLEDILAAPERLTTTAVRFEFADYLTRTKAIPNPGPRLQQQIDGLEIALQKSVEPVQIQLLSDNLTEVTLYRVGELGLFSEKALTLKPGIYTVVGKRAGYRDVRQEFNVSLKASQNAITIQCKEKISQG